ncbi:hypothetical protein YB2330_000152 [Saitoella coloradoensis]
MIRRSRFLYVFGAVVLFLIFHSARTSYDASSSFQWPLEPGPAPHHPPQHGGPEDPVVFDDEDLTFGEGVGDGLDNDDYGMGPPVVRPPPHGLPGVGSGGTQPLPVDIEPVIPGQEKYPVPSGSVISLPTAATKALPRVQHTFEAETEAEKTERLKRREEIKTVMVRDWSAYKKYAWGHDELAPVTNTPKDPYAGWAATIVDALDTLIIMDLDDEYEAAKHFVSGLDFSSSRARFIPVFETTIRYLGGLLSAYDLSGGKDKVLLEKATELGNMLMGAFDTPNRMPILKYDWQNAPSQRLRSETNAVAAELGSLTLEFTRLAQLTGQDKFFDAVQRVTDSLEVFAKYNSSIEGLFPLRFDASGCRPQGGEEKIKTPLPPPPPPAGVFAKTEDDVKAEQGKGRLVKRLSGHAPEWPSDAERKAAGYGELAPFNGAKAATGPEFSSNKHIPQPKVGTGAGKGNGEGAILPPSYPANKKIQCEEVGLRAWGSSQKYSVAGMIDSLYESLIKEHALLGGAAEQYAAMYTTAAEAIKENILFKPEFSDNADVLLAGQVTISPNEGKRSFQPEMQHLTCFIGGMFGLGSKLLGREADLAIAEKLTEGCVKGYEVMETGVMPEIFLAKYQGSPATTTKKDKPAEKTEGAKLDVDEATAGMKEVNIALVAGAVEGREAQNNVTAGTTEESTEDTWGSALHGKVEKDKRALVDLSPDIDLTSLTDDEVRSIYAEYQQAAQEDIATKAQAKKQGSQLGPPTFKTASNANGEVERIVDPKYILRPEAIESVFYMWRITGDKKWREKGWKMWKAIETATRSSTAHSAISNVDSKTPVLTNSMESFWFAETLKYFYLLYSEPSLISLDEYVLNTEAHPFRRPVV